MYKAKIKWSQHDDVIKWKHYPQGTGEFPAQRPVTENFDVFFDLHPNKRLSKQWWGWWFETPSCPLWRHRNELHMSWNTIWCVDCLFRASFYHCSVVSISMWFFPAMFSTNNHTVLIMWAVRLNLKIQRMFLSRCCAAKLPLCDYWYNQQNNVS